MRRRQPHRLLPTLDEVVLAPEVATLAALRAAIDIAIVALTAAHPELWPTPVAGNAGDSDDAVMADDVIRAAQALAIAIDAYSALLRPTTSVM